MGESVISIAHNPLLNGTVTQLPSSKSISNRALILKALAGNQSVVSNLSSARDTKLMSSLIGSAARTIDVQDAGTTMRFLTAYFSLTRSHKILTGTERMMQRPIKLLVDSLRKLGAEVEYLQQEGFPPIETKGFIKQLTHELHIAGDVSSQYISALMMVAPTLPLGLTIYLDGKIGSRPYIEMTASMMRSFGVSAHFTENKIVVPTAKYNAAEFTVEADWSAASYWYGFTALAKTATITLPNITRGSLQGDSVIVELMKNLGVNSEFQSDTLLLTKQSARETIEWDFSDCPDLAQTVIPVCAAKNIVGNFTGLESLRIKETDRIAALQAELGKIGAVLAEEAAGQWRLIPGKLGKAITIKTYHDHRMAMGFAPLATLTDLVIESPDVVNKSYAGFWQDMQAVGFRLFGDW